MENQKPHGDRPKPSRRTLRLTLKVTNGEFELLSSESLEMITPPQAGGQPEEGKHPGFWMELQDGTKNVLAHRLLNLTQLNSVEVHSPDGTIERRFGQLRDGVFVVLLPDLDEGRSAVLIGESLAENRAETAAKEGSGELARFELPGRGKGGE